MLPVYSQYTTLCFLFLFYFLQPINIYTAAYYIGKKKRSKVTTALVGPGPIIAVAAAVTPAA
jgi:hypothetical protein